MKKLLLFTIALITVSSAKVIAQQWTQIGYMIVNGTDTANNSHVIKGFGPDVFCGTAKGLFKSSDNGGTWTNISYNNAVILNQDIYSVFVASNGNIFAGSNKRLFKSIDGGANWTWLSILPDSSYYYDISEIGGNILVSYVKGSIGGVYYSGNFGGSWTAATGITSAVHHFLVDGTTLFLGGTTNGVYKSADNGQTWSISGTGFPSSAGIWGVIRSGTKLFANSVTGIGLYESSDNGGTWVSSSPLVFNGFCQVFAFCQNNNTIILSNDGACNPAQAASIRMSTDGGGSWNNFLTGTTSPNYFPVIGKNSSGTSFFIKSGNGKKVYRYDNSTGLQTLSNEESFISVSPNPSSDKILITIDHQSLQNTKLEICDLVGKCVYSMPVSQPTSEVDLSSVNRGIYFVKIKSAAKTYTKKIILQ